jgi:hypothetical protein
MKYRLTNINPGNEYISRWVIERHTFWRGWHRVGADAFFEARLAKDPSEFKTEAEARAGFAQLTQYWRDWNKRHGYHPPVSVDIPTEDR